MSYLFQKVKEQFNNKLPFVCYCKPNSDKIIALLQKDATLFELRNEDCGFAFVSFDNEKRYLIPENNSDIYFETVSTSDFIFENNFASEINFSDKNNFENLVQSGLESIQNGTFEKVVLSRKETIEVDNFDLELVFKKLVFNYKTAFKYFFFHPEIGFWIGATPEQFLKVDDDFVKTVSLAGTQTFDKNVETIWQNKEIKEQQIVTDYIVNNLKLFSDDVTFSKPYNQQAGSLVHIKTDIQAKINGRNSIPKIIELLHPTPAVCGFPKDKAKQFIVENEGYNREFYAGFLGEWNKDFQTYKENRSDLFVNLRCMKIENKEVNLYIGCGITKDSNPEKEFIETVNKSMTIKKVL
ncbi:chorismate-binding protein [Flavobacterium sp.]|uniref:chorismate-binding protein n=1 Tax=Flavobacterium sp. TaxID=239 RepID=UPI002612D7FC|nr:chorismate-binding protein [Flavobacterium sp.]